MLTAEPASLTPILPPELERQIFETAAREHKGLAHQLILVAHRVYIWIEPIIYTVMHLELDWDDDAFVEETLKNKPPSFFAQHVKALCITCVHPVETLRLMSMCEGVVNFACWAGTDTGESAILPALSSFRRLQRLTMNFQMVFSGPPNFSLPLFAEITHLEVLDLPSWWDEWTGFELLSNLTHLAFYTWGVYEDATDVLRHILLNCKSLQFLVFVYVESLFHPDCQSLDDELDDPRVVFIPVNFPISKDWEDGARGGTQGVWVRAEKKVAEKQRRELHDPSLS